MIINDTHRFLFVHIPKCAGTAIRQSLHGYDETNGAYTGVAEHPQLGYIDYMHIPLFVLQGYFSEEFAKLTRYGTYAVVRDPFVRFPSSLSQHLRSHCRRPIQEISPRSVRLMVDQLLRLLEDYRRPGSYLPYQYIHFQRQVDFVYHEGECLVENVYTIDRVDKMVAEIGARFGTNLAQMDGASASRANETRFYRNALVRSVVKPAKPILKICLSPRQWGTLKEVVGKYMFVSSDKSLRSIFNSDYVREFIADYYQDDIRLFQRVRESGQAGMLKAAATES